MAALLYLHIDQTLGAFHTVHCCHSQNREMLFRNRGKWVASRCRLLLKSRLRDKHESHPGQNAQGMFLLKEQRIDYKIGHHKE